MGGTGPGSRSRTVAPVNQVGNNSSAATSKVSEANCSTRSLVVRPHWRANARLWLTSARCVISTPFGCPVDPEV